MAKNDIIPIEDHFFTCDCSASEHTLRFSYDPDDNTMYVHYFLDNNVGILTRIALAIQYIFGRKSKYGHFGEWIMHRNDAVRMQTLIQRVIDGDK